MYPLWVKKGFALAKPHLKTAAKSIASDVFNQAVGKMSGLMDQGVQEGLGGIMVLARKTRKRPPGHQSAEALLREGPSSRPEYITLCQAGKQIPSKALQPQFNQEVLVREFYNMFVATGRHLKDLPLSIDRQDFERGYFLFLFNLNPGEDGNALSRVSSRALRLEMRFRQLLPNTVTLVVYACYDSILKIDSKR